MLLPIHHFQLTILDGLRKLWDDVFSWSFVSSIFFGVRNFKLVDPFDERSQLVVLHHIFDTGGAISPLQIKLAFLLYLEHLLSSQIIETHECLIQKINLN